MTVTVPLAQIEMLLQIMLRVAAIALSVPFLDNRAIPRLFKVGLVLAVSLLIYPQVADSIRPLGGGIAGLGVGALRELLLGIAVGLTVRSVFAGILMAGQLAGFQMGLSIANVLDPQSSMQVPVLGQLLNLMAMVIFVLLDAHHMLIRALVESFRTIPPLTYAPAGSLLEQMIRLSGAMFTVALQVGAPVIAALLLATVALGLVARAVPQMNVFVVAMPLQILIGLAFVAVGLLDFTPYLRDLFDVTGQGMAGVLRLGR
jgi:flagellar biosynthetic protein FliR